MTFREFIATGLRVGLTDMTKGRVRLHVTITTGFKATIGKEVTIEPSPGDLATLFATMARRPEYRHVFAAVARELERREDLRQTSPPLSERLRLDLVSQDTHDALVKAFIYATEFKEGEGS